MPGELPKAVQCIRPSELETTFRTEGQTLYPLLTGQRTASQDIIGTAQLQCTLTGSSPPLKVKVKVADAGQTVFGIVMVTCCVWPGANEPLVGVMVIPLRPLLETDQTTFPTACEFVLMAVWHIQP